eukprot:9249538-Pyramimonas_sp.AAC.1
MAPSWAVLGLSRAVWGPPGGECLIRNQFVEDVSSESPMLLYWEKSFSPWTRKCGGRGRDEEYEEHKKNI